MNPDKTKIVTIKRDDYHGVFIFNFPFSDDRKKPVYSMIGRLYIELGEDKLISYSVGLTEKNIFEIRIRIDWEDEEKEQQKLQEILDHWQKSNYEHDFLFSPLNLDLVLSSSFWSSILFKNEEIVKTTVKSGSIATYSGYEFKWKYHLRNP